MPAGIPVARVVAVLRASLACLGLVGLLASSISAIAGCQPPSETTREKATTDTSGYALIHAAAPGDNHHWNIDVAMKNAPVGTYALVFSTTEPTSGRPVLEANDPALRCAAAHGKSCTLRDHGDIVAKADVGPGGTGVLRAAFDVGPGGWFTLVRVEGAGSSTSVAALDIQLVSEALSKDEEPHRFVVDVR